MINLFLSGMTVLGALVSALMALAIWLRSGAEVKKHNQYLCWCLVACAVTYGLYGSLYLIETLALQYSWLFFVPMVTELLLLPPCYLYIRALYQPVTGDDKARHWLHILPFIAVFLLVLPILLGPEQARLDFIRHWFAGTYIEYLNSHRSVATDSFLIGGSLFIVQLVVYLILIRRKYHSYQKGIESIFSDIETIKLNWVLGLLIVWGLYLSIYCVYFALPLMLDNQANPALAPLVFLLMIGFFLYVAMQAWIHPELFTQQEYAEIETFKTDEAKQKYQNDSISPEAASNTIEQLKHYMEVERPYLEATLTINHLTHQLGLRRSAQLSQILSQHLGENFYQFVNRYRIAEAKRLLDEHPNQSIIDVTLNSGFNSTSTFYTHFKNFVGMTPKDYLAKTANKEDSEINS